MTQYLLRDARAMSMRAPRHTHDCDSCTYLGRYCEYDLYIHNSTLIARYGSEGSHYLSGLLSINYAEAPIYPIGIAKARALAYEAQS